MSTGVQGSWASGAKSLRHLPGTSVVGHRLPGTGGERKADCPRTTAGSARKEIRKWFLILVHPAGSAPGSTRQDESYPTFTGVKTEEPGKLPSLSLE